MDGRVTKNKGLFLFFYYRVPQFYLTLLQKASGAFAFVGDKKFSGLVWTYPEKIVLVVSFSYQSQ